MTPKKHLTALLTMLTAIGLGVVGWNDVMAAARAGHGNMKLATAHPAANPAAMPGTPGSDIVWVKFQDPLEQAFTLDVPRGWTVKGGMFRLGYSDHRVMVDMTSPDGRTNVRLGDVAVPTYFLPNQFHHEGEVYDLGAQAQGRVARYRSGQEFAQAYSRARFARVCQSLTPQHPSPPSGTPQSANGASTGELTSTCSGSQGMKTADVFAQTQLAGGLWQVTNLSSFITPDPQVPMARDIAIRAINSLKLNPEWIRKQNKYDEDALVYQRQRQQGRMRVLSQQVAQFEQGMQARQSQVDSFERGQAQRQKQFQGFDNVIAGVTPTRDPYGNSVSVSTGPKSYYYRNPGTGAIVNADKSPGAGWDLLTPQQ